MNTFWNSNARSFTKTTWSQKWYLNHLASSALRRKVMIIFFVITSVLQKISVFVGPAHPIHSHPSNNKGKVVKKIQLLKPTNNLHTWVLGMKQNSQKILLIQQPWNLVWTHEPQAAAWKLIRTFSLTFIIYWLIDNLPPGYE